METVDPLPPASGLSAPPPLQTSRSVPAFKDQRPKRTSPRSGAYAFTVANTRTNLNYGASSSKDTFSTAKWPTTNRANTTRAAAPTTTTTTNFTPAKPLVPATERKTHEANKSSAGRSRKDSDLDGANVNAGNKWDITPDGGSAGREGRQFAVANVGNNGRIYLRYVALPHASLQL